MNKIILNGKEIEYTIKRKAVKNINLRIKSDGSVYVSAGSFVPQKKIEEFISANSRFILNAIEKFENRKKIPLTMYFSEREIRDVIIRLCEKVYPYFEKRGICFPHIKFRKMVSQWGNCRSREGILTFNINLMYVPFECVEYVVLHEFTHFIEANHSKNFYAELEKVCPDWRERRKILKNISLHE